HRERQALIPGGSGLELQLLRQEIEPAADVEGPALPRWRQNIPAMNVGHCEPALDADVVNRPAEMQARTDGAVHRAGLTADECGPLAQAGAVQRQVEIDTLRGDEPAALQSE